MLSCKRAYSSIKNSNEYEPAAKKQKTTAAKKKQSQSQEDKSTKQLDQYKDEITGKNDEDLPGGVFRVRQIDPPKGPKVLATEKLLSMSEENIGKPYSKCYRLWQRDNCDLQFGSARGKNFVVATPEQIVMNLRSRRFSERVLNEEIYGPVSLFGDFDNIDEKVSIRQHAKLIVDDLVVVCQKANLTIDPATEILLSFSSGRIGNQTKVGCHFLIRKNNLYFSDVEHQKLFWEEYKSCMKYESYLDMQVYCNNRGYRTLYSDKFGQDRHIKAYDFNADKLVSSGLVDTQLFMNHLVTNVSGERPLLSEKYKDMVATNQKNVQSVELDDPIEIDEMDSTETVEQMKKPLFTITYNKSQSVKSIKPDKSIQPAKSIEPVKSATTLEKFKKLLQQVTELNFELTEHIDNSKDKNHHVFKIDGGICPMSRLTHRKYGEGNMSFVITKQSNTILKISGKCFKGKCIDHNHQHHTKFEWVYKIKGRCVYKKNMLTKEEILISDTDTIRAIRDLSLELFPSAIHVPFLIDPLYRFKKLKHFGMKYKKYRSQWVKPFIFSDTEKTIGIKASCGTGKSTQSIESLSKHKFKRLLVLSTRQTLSTTIKEKFDANVRDRMNSTIKVMDENDSDFQPFYIHCENETLNRVSRVLNYMDVEKDELAAVNSLVISPDSCVHLLKNGELESYDCVWFDEIESGLEYIVMSETLCGKRLTVWKVVRQIIETANYFLFTDANLSDTTLEAVSYMREVSTTVIYHNTTTKNRKKYVFVRSLEAGEVKLVEMIKSGNRICVPCDSQTQAKFIHEYLERLKQSGELVVDTKILYYDGKSSQADKKRIANCDQEWSAVDVVIYTPVIVYGVDYNGPPFDYVFGFFTGYTVNARAAYQMLERAREVKMKRVYICMPRYAFAKRPDSIAMTLDEVVLGMNYMLSDVDNLLLKHRDLFGGLDEEAKKIMAPKFYECPNNPKKSFFSIDTRDPFAIMMRDYIFMQQQSKSKFVHWLMAYVCESGGKFEVEDLLEIVDQDVENRIEKMKSSKEVIRKEINDAYAASIQKAVMLSHEEYQKLKRKKSLNNDEKYAMEKYQIAYVYGETEPTSEFIANNWNEKSRSKFNGFVAFARCVDYRELKIVSDLIHENVHMCEALDGTQHRLFEIYTLMKLLGIEVGKDFCLVGLPMTQEMKQFVDERKEVWSKWFKCMKKWRANKTMKQIDLVNMLIRLMNKVMTPLFRKISAPTGKPTTQRVDGKQKKLYYFAWSGLEENIKQLHKRMEVNGHYITLQKWAEKPHEIPKIVSRPNKK